MLTAVALLLAWRLSPYLLLQAYLAWSLWESLRILRALGRPRAWQPGSWKAC